MSPSTPGRAVIVATAIGLGALGSALAAGAALQHRAAQTSHQLPTPETIFEARPPTSAELVAQGRKLFLASCAHCHGADARGDEGPDLHDAQVSDRYIRNIVRHGIPHEMPSFAKKHNDADITALIAYVRSLE